MTPYKKQSKDSGVVAFENATGAITVEFQDGWRYLYTNQSAGAANVKVMKQLAAQGSGLSTFISQHVRKSYVRKWRASD
jgi:hypothetical protein